jgi:hypothetical protein
MMVHARAADPGAGGDLTEAEAVVACKAHALLGEVHQSHGGVTPVDSLPYLSKDKEGGVPLVHFYQ